jgi:hypothetical protein
MNARNILLSSGYELAFGQNVPHLDAGKSGNLIGRSYDTSNVRQAGAKENAIFRVWSTNMTGPAAFPTVPRSHARKSTTRCFCRHSSERYCRRVAFAARAIPKS